MEGAEEVGNSELPEHLVFYEILSKLPPKSLTRFRCVSKSWLNRISGDSSFSQSHLAQRSADDTFSIIVGERKTSDESRNLMPMSLSHKTLKATEIDMPFMDTGSEINIIGSCDGLVCLFQYLPDQRILLWNPATQHMRRLPYSPTATTRYEKDYDPCMGFGLGLGFDTASKDYKVVMVSGRAESPPGEVYFLRAQVFAKNGTFWRDGGVLEVADIDIYGQGAVTAEGALHWAVTSAKSMHGVASFDLRDEVFQLTCVPDECCCENSFNIGTWRNSLVAFAESETEWAMWASTSSGGIRRWNKIMKFPAYDREFIWPWRDQFVVLRYEEGMHSAKLTVVDAEAPHPETNLELPEDCRYAYPNATEYVESIISVF